MNQRFIEIYCIFMLLSIVVDFLNISASYGYRIISSPPPDGSTVTCLPHAGRSHGSIAENIIVK